MLNNRLKYIALFLLLILYSVNLYAQDDFQEWLKKDQQQFENFLSEEDKAFSDFLKQEWKPYDSNKGKKRDAKPKPVTLPVVKEQDKPKPKPESKKQVKPVREREVDLKPIPKPEPTPKPKPVIKSNQNVLVFNYLKVPQRVNYKKDFDLDFSQGLNNKTLATTWEKMASSKFAEVVKQLDVLASEMNLNDWGIIQLLQSFVQKVIPENENKQIAFLWFLANKSGYDARIAFSANKIYLLIPATDVLYGNDFVKIGDKTYYFLKTIHKSYKLDKKVYTYKKTYKNDNKQVSLRLKQVPSLDNHVITKDLKFKYNSNEYAIPVVFKKDAIEFFRTYPQTQLDVYFGAPLSNEAASSLLNALKPHVENKSQIEAINFLLRFVQTAFSYQTDNEQFGREKYLMPEETLFYPKSDCEDRSIFFSFLVKNLLGMEIVGLDFPGHIATAVKFSSAIEGKSVNFKGNKYMICDPTYVNADVGMCMPQYENTEPKVISFN